MSLLTYQEARPWAKAIRDEVLSRRMPPFDAVKGVGEFRNDPSLSPPEMDLVVAWVEGGAPEGDAALPIEPLPQQRQSTSCAGRTISVRHSIVLSAPVTLCGILPKGPLEVTALLPDETVNRLIWIRDFHPRWNRTYEFRAPVTLPKGTRLLVHSPTGAAAELLTTHSPAP